MTKLLNIDELSPVEREVRIKGQTYAVAEQSVGQMLRAIRFAKSNQDEDGTARSGEDIIGDVIGVCRDIIPDCPVEVINTLSMRSINAILEFATASDQEVVETAERAEDGTAEKK